jgi:hypothetical protein
MSPFCGAVAALEAAELDAVLLGVTAALIAATRVGRAFPCRWACKLAAGVALMMGMVLTTAG